MDCWVNCECQIRYDYVKYVMKVMCMHTGHLKGIGVAIIQRWVGEGDVRILDSNRMMFQNVFKNYKLFNALETLHSHPLL